MAAKKSAIDTDLIRELANLLNDTDLGEVEVEEGDLRIRLARNSSVVAETVHVPAPVVSPAPAAAPAPTTPAAEPESAPAAAPAASGGTAVTSPMVGTAYLAPAPNAKPFVNVGDSVKAGQTIAIVEAMKTMNNIPCSQDGIVAAINVDDGQPVEFGETLITLK